MITTSIKPGPQPITKPVSPDVRPYCATCAGYLKTGEDGAPVPHDLHECLVQTSELAAHWAAKAAEMAAALARPETSADEAEGGAA
jgi:hypothetical protein